MVPSFFCISKVFVWKCVWPLSLSLYLFPLFSLWLQDTCHLMPFTKYSLLDQSYFFTSCLSIAHIKFTNKIHQLFTDYLLRLPYSELLETHLFRSRANRRLVCNFYCIFPGKGLPHFCHTKVLPRNIAARLPQVYHGKNCHNVCRNFCPALGAEKCAFFGQGLPQGLPQGFTTEWRLIFRAFLRKNAKALIPIWAALWIPWSSRRVLISPHWCVHVCARVSRKVVQIHTWESRNRGRKSHSKCVGGLGGWFVENRFGQEHVRTQSRQHDQNYRKNVRACIRQVQTCFVLRQGSVANSFKGSFFSVMPFFLTSIVPPSSSP